MTSGNLPIKALQFTLTEFFQNANPNFKEELISEIQFNNLAERILYVNEKCPISDLAEIGSDRVITIHEPYLAFLWTLSYLAICMYYESDAAIVDLQENPTLSRAIEVFEYGVTLHSKWSEWDISLPNPESYDLAIDKYVLEANGVFAAATAFILCHEYSHHYLGHDLTVAPTDKDEAIAEEYAADKNAVDILIEGILQGEVARQHTTKTGIVIGICSLLFDDGCHQNTNCWDGGDTHPDTDERVIKLLEQVSASDENDEGWAWAVTSLIAWAIIYNKAGRIALAVPRSKKEDLITMFRQMK